MKTKIISALIIFLFVFHLITWSQKTSFAYTVKMENPEWHFFQVELVCTGIKKSFVDFKMPVWTPGYYQRMDYFKNVTNFRAADEPGTELKWDKTADNTWRVYTNGSNTVKLFYEIKAERAFVANPYLDENRAYILPAGVFFHIDKMINQPVRLTVVPPAKWNRVATGLDSVAKKKFTYTAPDFDVLYDSPLLVGNLEELPPFRVRGINHRFIGYKLGEFDRRQFMKDLQEVVEASVNIIGHIPYKHYTFIAIGPGPGGIEHLNNTTFGFYGSGLNNRDNYTRMLHFLAHEYFHHYNVKRIRPIELGPFDYDNGNRTSMLWFSEGLSVYYEYLVVRRADITSDDELLNTIRKNIVAYESKPGKLYQTLEEASNNTWSDGPFGRTGDEVNKTISYYEKGPLVGLILDFKIRHATANKKSLDDVMRLLYHEYYLEKKRGFTEKELQQAFETVADTSLAEEFEYISTTKILDYPKYFGYAGLRIDTSAKVLPETYAGLTLQEKEDSVFIAAVDFDSPAWFAGLRKGQYILELNNQKASINQLNKVLQVAKPGYKLLVTVPDNTNTKKIEVLLSRKTEKTFSISFISYAGPLQKQIQESWLKGKDAYLY